MIKPKLNHWAAFCFFVIAPGVIAASGDLDTTFGIKGKVTAGFADQDNARGVAVQADGNIVIAGRRQSSSGYYEVAVARYMTGGALDTTFNATGKVTTAMGADSAGNGVAIQSDGKIVVAGYSWNGSNYDFAVVRYTTTGALDTTFNTTGKVTTGIGSSDDYGQSVAIQSDGKIVVAGYIYDSGDYDFAVVRYTASGALDTTFNGTGKTTFEVVTGGNDYAQGVAIQSDGKIVVAGYQVDSAGAGVALARLTTTGALDASFDGNGLRFVTAGTSDTYGYGLALQSDGKLVVTGSVWNGNDWDMVTFRFLTDGSNDASFGTGGYVQSNLGTGDDIATAVTVQSDGKIVATGQAAVNYSGTLSPDTAVVRYTSSGVLDTTFNSNGMRTYNSSSTTASDFGSAVVMQSDGQIVVAGTRYVTGSLGNPDFSLLRFTSTGGLGMTVSTDFCTTFFSANASVMQPDGKTIVVGSVYDNNAASWPDDFAIARYTVTGALDSTFAGGQGWRSFYISGQSDVARAVALQGDGKIVLAGDTNNGTNRYFTTMRVSADGVTLDTSFDGDGVNYISVGGYPECHAAVLQTDGKLLLAGQDGADLLVMRLTTAGVFDTSFNTTGYIFTDLGGSDYAESLALQSDGKIVVGGYSYNYTTSRYDFALARYTTSGTLDTTLNSTGMLTTSFGSNYSLAHSVAVQSDGKILLAGNAYNGSNYDVALVRYTGSGALDTTFNSTGKVLTDLSFSPDQASALLIQGNGKILLGGGAGSGSSADFALLRYNADGSLDTTFSADGMVRVPVGTAGDYCSGIGTYGGEIVLAGGANVGSHSNFALVAVQSGDPGSLDSSFSNDGVSITPIYSGATLGDGRATSVVIQPDGKIVAAGWMSFSSKDFVITRSNADSTLDSSFGTGGVVKVDFGYDDVALSVALQSDGRIIAAGLAGNGTNDDFAMIRLNTDGTLDTTFNSTGKVTLDWNLGGQKHDRINRVLVQGDGKIIAAGYAYNGTNVATFAIARYNSNGTLDSSYGTGGKVTLSFGGGDENALAAALQSDGKLVVGGAAKVGSQFDCALARFTTSGTLDASFGTAGKLTLGIGADYDEISDLLIQPDGKIFGLGTFKNPTLYDLIGLRFNSDGSLDPTFDGDGKKSYQMGAVDDYGKSVALQVDGRIVMAGYFVNSTGNSDMGIIRVNADGSYDTSFNASGILKLAPGPSDDRLYGVAIDGSNNIIAVGQSNTADNHGQFAMVRVLGLPLPGVSLAAVSGLAQSSVTLNGTVNPRSTPATARFEYGTTTSYGLTATVALAPNNGTTAQNVSAGIFALASGTTYHYRLTATTAYGTSVTSDATFTTPLAFAYSSASDVPVTASSYTATGNTASFSLNFAPATGTSLTVVNNTGTGFINGRFGNLAQGQTVTLSFNGALYRFVANYYGGTGNDLVLQWADVRLVGWGLNIDGQLGNNTTTSSSVPVGAGQGGALSNKTLVAVAPGISHCLALCSDGTLAAWGYGGNGRLGNNSMTNSLVPVAVVQNGVLAGKTVIAVAAGGAHSLALCSDGTLAAWGYNGNGQLGNNSTTQSLVPVAVTQSGVLSGKTVVAVAAGNNFSLALCSDGTVAAWGYNGNGQLGNNSTTQSLVPVAVVQSGVLAGKTVVAVAAGGRHSLAACTDGTSAAWGYNANGQLGNNSTTQSLVPVAVTQSGVLSGKTVVAVATGDLHSLALCSDGTLAAWGYNGYGQLGNNSTTTSLVPVAVTQSGILSGKTVVAMAAGFYYSVARCTDGTVATWGDNSYGQLGNNSTTQSLVPVTVSTATLAAGERLVTAQAGCDSHYVMALAAAPPNFITTAATAITAAGATLNGTVNAQGVSTAVSFDYGLTTAYGTSVAATPSPVSGSTPAAVAATVTGLNPGTVYHYRVSGTSSNGTSTGGDLTFVTPLANVSATYNSATDIPVSSEAVTIADATVNFALNFAPATGTSLTVINNTGRNFITGQFSNLAQGQTVTLNYSGVSYDFVANYYGGTGNDLVLVWKDLQPWAWGYNSNGQLGNNSTTDSPVPVAVSNGGVLAGKTVSAVAAGNSHSLALCSDGTLAAWGYNGSGQLGNNSTTNSPVPVAVSNGGVLAGKTVIAVAAGNYHSLALCSDGTLAAWGYNYYGQLGNNSTTNSPVPVAVVQNGVLAGRTVIAVAAGNYHSLALCSDGTLAAWGFNGYGQLGNNSTTQSNVPVAVVQSGALTSKTVIAVAAGSNHSLALCSDGTLAAWGNNGNGQLGNNSTTQSNVPVAVVQNGVLAGKTAIAVAAGNYHSLALCSDGTLAAWGYNGMGQLGNNSTTQSNVPVAVVQNGVLASKTMIAVEAGNYHSVVLCSDGTLAAWGYNYYGQLGNNSTTQSNIPVLVSTSPLAAGQRFTRTASGSTASHSLVLVASPPTPVVTTLAATSITTTGVTLNGLVNPKDNDTTVTFDYGTTTAYGSSVAAVPLLVTGSGNLSVNITLTGLTPGTVYHFRVSGTSNAGTSNAGTSNGADAVFATALPNLTPVYNSVDDLPVAAEALTIAANTTVNPSLNFAPPTGTTLTILKNTGTGFISDRFSNLAQGQTVTLTYNGVNYYFVANYYGGTGNDLVLVWKDMQPWAWGNNGNGQLGNNSTTQSNVPVAVSSAGVLAGKTIIATAAGNSHSLALCSDGTLAAWGNNFLGQLGNNSTTSSPVPVAVVQNGVLAGKTVIAVAAGFYHSLALCSDGTLAAWGYNGYGQLGNNSTTQSNVPVAVVQNGVLAGKTAIAVAAGFYHSLALCSDGTLAAWGYNYNGQLGDNSTTQSNVPVLVSTIPLAAGQRFTRTASGSTASHSLALVASPPPPLPTATTLAASNVTTSSVTLNGSITANNNSTAVTFDYGTTTAYGSSVAATPSPVNGSTATAVSAALTGLAPGTTYHYRVTGVSVAGTSSGSDMVFTTAPSNNANLSALTLSQGTLTPTFNSFQTSYSATVPNATAAITVFAAAAQPDATIYLTGAATTSTGTAGSNINLNTGGNLLFAIVTAQDGTTTKTYTVNVTRNTLPSLTLPASPVIAEATSTSGAVVSFTVTANDAEDGARTPSVAPASGSTFAIGDTTVNASVTDSFGETTTGSFIVRVLSQQQSWRQLYFGTTSNTGNAADNADPDGDGLPNLLEWACGLNPTTSSTLNTTTTRNGPTFEYTYTRSVDAVNAGTMFLVEWTDTLPGTSWSSTGVTQQILSDNGTMQIVKASVPVGSTGRRFVHLSVTSP